MSLMPRTIIVSRNRTPGLFGGALYAEVVVNEKFVGEAARSGCQTNCHVLLAFVDALTDVTQEQKEAAKAQLRAIFGVQA